MTAMNCYLLHFCFKQYNDHRVEKPGWERSFKRNNRPFRTGYRANSDAVITAVAMMSVLPVRELRPCVGRSKFFSPKGLCLPIPCMDYVRQRIVPTGILERFVWVRT